MVVQDYLEESQAANLRLALEVSPLRYDEVDVGDKEVVYYQRSERNERAYESLHAIRSELRKQLYHLRLG